MTISPEREEKGAFFRPRLTVKRRGTSDSRRAILVLLLTACGSLFTIQACQKTTAKEEVQPPMDTQPPTISISEPNVPYGMEGISQKEGVITLRGMAEDDREVIRVRWENHRGGKGWAKVNIRGTQTDWEVKEIPLEPGDNKITLTAQDRAANAAVQTLWVVRTGEIEFISYPDASETDLAVSESREVVFRVAVQIASNRPDSPHPSPLPQAGEGGRRPGEGGDRADSKTEKGVKIESVKLLKVNENAEPLDTLGEMYDDGKSEHGDEVPADGVYSTKVTLLEGAEGKIRFRVVVSGLKEGSGQVTASSEPFSVTVLRKWTREEWDEYRAVERQARDLFERLAMETGKEQARRDTVEWLRKQPGVKSAGMFEDGFSFVMESGLELLAVSRERFRKRDIRPEDLRPGHANGTTDCIGNVCTTVKEDAEPDTPEPAEPRKTKLGPLRFKLRQEKDRRAALTNPKVLVGSAFPEELPPIAYDDVADLFKNHRCPVFETKRKLGGAVGVELLGQLASHNVVVLDTHGEAVCRNIGGWSEACPRGAFPPPSARAVTFTKTPVTDRNDDRYADALRAGHLIRVLVEGEKVPYYAVGPSFVRKQAAKFPTGALVFNGSCRSLYGSTLAQAFESAGAAAYLGYSEYVSTCYDSPVVRIAFTRLLLGSTIGQAYADAVAAHGPTDASCSSAPETFPATLILAGNPDLKIIVAGLNNPSFEQGPGFPPPGWEAKGDVQVITRIGPITAKEGLYMAYLSTGENAEDQSKSSLEQPFCVPAEATKLSFDYRLVSEEPDEFLNSGYRDTFEAVLIVGGGGVEGPAPSGPGGARTVLASETTDAASWTPITGIDLEGGDRTAFATDWKRIASDLPDSARTEGATLAFKLQDNGDHVYDTVALIDDVRLE